MRNKPWLDQTGNHYKIVTTMLIHTWNEHLNIQANKMVDKIQPYNVPLWLFRDKTLKQTLDLKCELGTVEQNSLTPNFRI